MDEAEFEQVTDLIRRAHPNELRSALYAVVRASKKAKADETANPQDQSLGWFADGMATSLQVLQRSLPGGGSDD